ncbi:MAG TPA: hypothetical protein VJI75_06890 [Candidatus Nanoarchaeia archaeon]|nr:hypothetical protein [Candidatus Nanoarchaeia archaeon]
MKKLFAISSVLIFCFLLTQTIATVWSWENHVGVSQWSVKVIEDETGCGGSSKTESVAVTITHNREIADISDFAHGKMRGTFTGNTLSVPGRTIRDGSGNSRLAPFDMAFAQDCQSFSGEYSWDYSDSYSECSGSTKLRGTRLGSAYCPGTEEQQLSEIAAARAASADKEDRYKDILAKDPKNFWANWDMAELKKRQGKYDEYLDYVDKATSNEDIFQDTRAKLKKEAANRLHISDFPTKTSSPILRIEMDELNNWNGGFINKVNVPKEEASDKEKWYMKYWTIRIPESYEIINKIVGLPEN